MTLPDWFFSRCHSVASIAAHSRNMYRVLENKPVIFYRTVFIVEYDREYDNQTKEWICKQ